MSWWAIALCIVLLIVLIPKIRLYLADPAVLSVEDPDNRKVGADGQTIAEVLKDQDGLWNPESDHPTYSLNFKLNKPSTVQKVSVGFYGNVYSDASKMEVIDVSNPTPVVVETFSPKVGSKVGTVSKNVQEFILTKPAKMGKIQLRFTPAYKNASGKLGNVIVGRVKFTLTK